MSVNKKLAIELDKSVIEQIKNRRVYTRFKDNVWEAGLVDMGSLSSKNRNVKHLLCVMDVFTKYAWVKTLTDKKSKTVLNAFIEKF